MKITDEMVEAGGAALDRLDRDGNRATGFDRGVVLAVLRAAAPLIAAQVLRDIGGQIVARTDELRRNYRTGNTSIEYINGMEDAATWIDRAITATEVDG